MTQLTDFYLSGNQLNGSIPSELGNLSQLHNLGLSNNQLSGSIPSELGNLTLLTGLYLSNNLLNGSIPSELGNLTQLTGLHLQNNQLNGSIPSELGNLIELTWLKLNNNQLSGEIPASLSNLSNLFKSKSSGDATALNIISGLDISNNQLIASDIELIDFLNINNPNWNQANASITEPVSPDDGTTTPVDDSVSTPQIGFSDCSSNIIFGLCNNYGVLTDVIFETSANVAGGELAGTINNKGLLSNFTNQPNALVSGGKLTGYIENEGTLANFEFVGAMITGGILSGTIYNNSEVGGFFKDVQLAADTIIIGGTLIGNIQGDCEAPAKLKNITIKSVSNLSCVIIDNSNKESISSKIGITLGQGVQFADLTNLTGTTDGELPVTDGDSTGTIAETNLPSLNGAININSRGKTVNSNALFASGIAVNNGSFERNVLSILSDNIDIRGRIEVESAHIGQTIDIAVVAAQLLANNALHYFMLNTSGDFIPWDEDMGSLLSIQTVEASATPIEVQMYYGQLNDIGPINFYIGYRLTDGTVIYSPETLKITITE